MGYSVLYIYPLQQLILDSFILYIYTFIIPTIDFKYFTILSNLHCDILAMMSVIFNISFNIKFHNIHLAITGYYNQ